MLTEDLSSGDFRILKPDQYDLGRTKKRHGGILQITDEEYERLADRKDGCRTGKEDCLDGGQA